MEKVLTDSERIRRAEAIYARRRGIEVENRIEKEKGPVLYKLLFKILLLVDIVVLVFCFQNREIVFSEKFLNKFSTYSQTINVKVNGIINSLKDKDGSILIEDTVEVKNATSENTATKTVNDTIEAKEEVVNIDEEINQSIEEKIKSNYSFIKPIEGVVTSYFGDRESKYQNVTGYHTGIDIGAESGKIIKAAMEGKVTQVSNEGDYRKAFKN